VVLGVGLREETLEPVIFYRSNLKKSTWERTLVNWSENVPMLGGWVPRFEAVRL
jgi:hypothetical protein